MGLIEKKNDAQFAWHCAVDDDALASLGDNQLVHDVYDLAVTDNHGGRGAMLRCRSVR